MCIYEIITYLVKFYILECFSNKMVLNTIYCRKFNYTYNCNLLSILLSILFKEQAKFNIIIYFCCLISCQCELMTMTII